MIHQCIKTDSAPTADKYNNEGELLPMAAALVAHVIAMEVTTRIGNPTQSGASIGLSSWTI
jgi:hypothetical protein